MTTSQDPQQKQRSNGAIVGTCIAFVVGMTGMAYAAVPLYDMFCRVTGYNGTTQRVEQASDVILDEKVKVTFDANTSGGLPWEFKPVQRDIDVRIGETVQVMYRAKNLSSKPTTGQATFNVTPMQAGAYFNKVQCFCFTETDTAAGRGDGDAGGILRRSGHRQGGRDQGHQDTDAFLHLLPTRAVEAGRTGEDGRN